MLITHKARRHPLIDLVKMRWADDPVLVSCCNDQDLLCVTHVYANRSIDLAAVSREHSFGRLFYWASNLSDPKLGAAIFSLVQELAYKMGGIQNLPCPFAMEKGADYDGNPSHEVDLQWYGCSGQLRVELVYDTDRQVVEPCFLVQPVVDDDPEFETSILEDVGVFLHSRGWAWDHILVPPA